MNFVKSIQSFRFAFKGIAILMKENNFRIHLTATFLVVAAGVFLNISRIDWLYITIAIALVLCMEAFNTAVEKLTDYVCPDFHELAGMAKDVSAAGVLLAAVFSIIIGLVVFVPYL